MVVIVMGVVGAGKTTVGSLLARQLDWEFADADSFHPAANVEKIRRGIPLSDADRAPWIEAIHGEIVKCVVEHRNVVLACSALKRSYRERLCVGPEVKLVYLKGNYALIDQRLKSRHGHFADDQILANQFADLEEPEDAVMVDISGSPEEIVSEIRARMGLR